MVSDSAWRQARPEMVPTAEKRIVCGEGFLCGSRNDARRPMHYEILYCIPPTPRPLSSSLVVMNSSSTTILVLFNVSHFYVCKAFQCSYADIEVDDVLRAVHQAHQWSVNVGEEPSMMLERFQLRLIKEEVCM